MSNRTTIAALLAGLTLGFAAQAAEPAAAEAQAEATYAGLRVAIDPATGKIRPLSAADEAAVSRAVLRNTTRIGTQPRNSFEARATKRVRADGSVSVRVPADQMSQLEATIGPDGAVTVFEGSAPVARQEEVK